MPTWGKGPFGLAALLDPQICLRRISAPLQALPLQLSSTGNLMMPAPRSVGPLPSGRTPCPSQVWCLRGRHRSLSPEPSPDPAPVPSPVWLPRRLLGLKVSPQLSVLTEQRVGGGVAGGKGVCVRGGRDLGWPGALGVPSQCPGRWPAWRAAFWAIESDEANAIPSLLFLLFPAHVSHGRES